MPLFLDSFWRAAAYCLHPRVILLSLLPLVIMLAVSAALGYFFWGAAVASIATWLDASSIWAVVSGWLGMALIIACGMAATVLRARALPNPPAEEF